MPEVRLLMLKPKAGTKLMPMLAYWHGVKPGIGPNMSFLYLAQWLPSQMCHEYRSRDRQA